MIADEQPQHPLVGTPDARLLDADAFHEAVVRFIEDELPAWRDRADRPDAADEPRLNESLCDHLDCAARHSFDTIRFTHEPFQTSGRSADLAVKPSFEIVVGMTAYTIFEQIFPIECKRLPTPPDKNRSDCEYVHGMPGHRTGALERFKHGLHGPASRRAMIIAYVQNESFKHWRITINNRLDKMASDGADNGLWSPLELLKDRPLASHSGLHKLVSRHRRLKSLGLPDYMEIDHLWIKMN